MVAEAAPQLIAVPAVAVHGDFWAGNVLACGERLSVIDWTTFHYGAPLEDLITFAVSAVFRGQGSSRTVGGCDLGCVFRQNGALGRTQNAARQTLKRLNLPLEAMAPIFNLSLLCRLTRTEFADNPSWRVFVERYATLGLPAFGD